MWRILDGEQIYVKVVSLELNLQTQLTWGSSRAESPWKRQTGTQGRAGCEAQCHMTLQEQSHLYGVAWSHDAMAERPFVQPRYHHFWWEIHMACISGPGGMGLPSMLVFSLSERTHFTKLIITLGWADLTLVCSDSEQDWGWAMGWELPSVTQK